MLVDRLVEAREKQGGVLIRFPIERIRKIFEPGESQDRELKPQILAQRPDVTLPNDPEKRQLYYTKILRSRPGLIRIEEKRIERYINEGRSQETIDRALERKNRYVDQLSYIRQETNWTPKIRRVRSNPQEDSQANTLINPADETQDSYQVSNVSEAAVDIRNNFFGRAKNKLRYWQARSWENIATRVREGDYTTLRRATPGIFVAGFFIGGLMGSWVNDYTQSEEGRNAPITRIANALGRTGIDKLWPDPVLQVVERSVPVQTSVRIVHLPEGGELSVPQNETVGFLPPVVPERVNLLKDQPLFEPTVPSTPAINNALGTSVRDYFPEADLNFPQKDQRVRDDEFSSVLGKSAAIWFEAVTGEKINLSDIERRRRDIDMLRRLRGEVPTSSLEIGKIYQSIIEETNWYYVSAGMNGGPFLPNNPDIFAHFSLPRELNPTASTQVCNHELSREDLQRRGCALNSMVLPDKQEATKMINEVRINSVNGGLAFQN